MEKNLKRNIYIPFIYLPANAGDIRDAGSIPRLGRFPEEGMAAHSSILAWRTPWTEEPGGLQSIGNSVYGIDTVHILYILYICIYITESFCYTPETNTAL